jgi:hypothetical protein
VQQKKSTKIEVYSSELKGIRYENIKDERLDLPLSIPVSNATQRDVLSDLNSLVHECEDMLEHLFVRCDDQDQQWSRETPQLRSSSNSLEEMEEAAGIDANPSVLKSYLTIETSQPSRPQVVYVEDATEESSSDNLATVNTRVSRNAQLKHSRLHSPHTVKSSCASICVNDELGKVFGELGGTTYFPEYVD